MELEIELRGNNLYRNGEILSFPEGELMLIRDKIQWQRNTDDEYYTLKEWDRLDTLAYKKYQDYVSDPSKFWWIIADANHIHNPLDLRDYVGKEIVIPNILNVLMKLE